MSHLLCDKEDGIVTLTLNRPEARNSIDDEIMRQLSEHLEHLEFDKSLRVVLLTGAGGEAFCAGGDLKWLQNIESGKGGESMSRRMQSILFRLSNLPVPVIGILNGYALGGGTEIALSCDMRVMEKSSYLSFKQARVGLITGWGGGARLLRATGYARAMELLTTCRKISATEALAVGLANTIATDGEGLAEGMRIASQIAGSAPLAIRTIKKLLIEASERTLAGTAEIEASLFAELWTSEDHGEAVNAFLEKREPRFKGR